MGGRCNSAGGPGPAGRLPLFRLSWRGLLTCPCLAPPGQVKRPWVNPLSPRNLLVGDRVALRSWWLAASAQPWEGWGIRLGGQRPCVSPRSVCGAQLSRDGHQVPACCGALPSRPVRGLWGVTTDVSVQDRAPCSRSLVSSSPPSPVSVSPSYSRAARTCPPRPQSQCPHPTVGRPGPASGSAGSSGDPASWVPPAEPGMPWNPARNPGLGCNALVGKRKSALEDQRAANAPRPWKGLTHVGCDWSGG